MSKYVQIRLALLDIEKWMRELSLWQEAPPELAAFSSTEPFCIDTMSAEQWLQWVLLPKMTLLLDNQAPLPDSFAIYPYFELALAERSDELRPLLMALLALDNLFVPAES